MTATRDERRALGFVAGVLLLSAAVRAAALPDPVAAPGDGEFDLDAHLAATDSALAVEARRDLPLAPGETLDPNHAPVDELVRLSGVGPALARRIVEERERNGPFRAVPDLARVPGIGEKTLRRLAPHLALPPGPGGPGGPGRPGAGPGAGATGGVGAPGPVNVNTGGVGELTALPGIGPALAARIVAHRDSAGPFARVEELAEVPGIGPATLARIRDRATVR